MDSFHRRARLLLLLFELLDGDGNADDLSIVNESSDCLFKSTRKVLADGDDDDDDDDGILMGSWEEAEEEEEGSRNVGGAFLARMIPSGFRGND